MRATYPSRFILTNLVAITILSEEYISQSP